MIMIYMHGMKSNHCTTGHAPLGQCILNCNLSSLQLSRWKDKGYYTVALTLTAMHNPSTCQVQQHRELGQCLGKLLTKPTSPDSPDTARSNP